MADVIINGKKTPLFLAKGKNPGSSKWLGIKRWAPASKEERNTREKTGAHRRMKRGGKPPHSGEVVTLSSLGERPGAPRGGEKEGLDSLLEKGGLFGSPPPPGWEGKDPPPLSRRGIGGKG